MIMFNGALFSDRHMASAVRNFLNAESGVSAAEYALVGSIIAVVCIIALLALGKAT